MKRIAHVLMAFFLCLSIFSTDAQSIDGMYASPGMNFITIKDHELTVVYSRYELYGRPSTLCQYFYKIKWINETTINLKLKHVHFSNRPKIGNGGPRAKRKSYNPHWDGLYQLNKLEDHLELKSVESDKTITLTRKVIQVN
ncbi:MAG: hypothetical protein EP305_12775 [Bacteroidetes bacterium]|nr:MAG: hypothetical protein EP305_12775 [Bacteroidota bacterium]